jgi:hypothetical protein
MNWQRLSFWLLLSLAFFGSVSRVEAMGPEYQKAFERELRRIIDRNPRYVWGGSMSEKQGLDCSGYLFLAAHRAGLPVARTTAARMMIGENGWIGISVPLNISKQLDLVGWTFKRQFDHVGVLWHDNRHVSHASSRRGVVVDDLKGTLRSNITRIRRLSIGDR